MNRFKLVVLLVDFLFITLINFISQITIILYDKFK